MKEKSKLTMVVVLGVILLIADSIYAQRYMENLGRGVIAVYRGSGQVYIGWRMLGTDPTDIAFNVYRGTTKLNTSLITSSTNYIDYSGSTSYTYSVRPVIGSQEQESSASVSVWGQQYLSVPIQEPAGGTSPGIPPDYTPVPYTYTANDCSVGDLDGDGDYEIVLKWDPSNSQDNAHSGYTGNVFLDAYEMDGTRLWRIDLGINIRAGAHYTQFMVYDLDSDGRAEVACKTAPGTVDGLGNDVILPGDDPDADYRNSYGYILSGPEYLTIFDGLTGAELVTTDYIPPRGNVCDWGDCSGNRVDRFLACIAYLDGKKPSLVMCRGYYTRTVLAAWDWRKGQLTQRWVFDTGFSGGPWSAWKGQGNHNLSVGDVDGDGKDEIMYGACAIDDNGTGLYTTGLGHGDAMHFSDMDPGRPGMEVFTIHEGSGSPGASFRDADNGTILWQTPNADAGRGMASDIDPRYLGYECWTSSDGYIFDAQGNTIYAKPSNMFINFGIWWDGDLLRELLDGTTISDWDWTMPGRVNLIYAPANVTSNNYTKKTPCLSADILGDWREEVIWRRSDNTGLQIWTTTITTSHRLYTLMHDPVYRLGIAWQNVAYNQPPHTGFFLGDGMADPPTPDIFLAGPWIYSDFTGDNIVNMADLYKLSQLWLETNCNLTADLDIDGDCEVNLLEFSQMARYWLEGIP